MVVPQALQSPVVPARLSGHVHFFPHVGQEKQIIGVSRLAFSRLADIGLN
jgi:hypothetical protein